MADQYYYELLGQEFGPVSLSVLQLVVRNSQIGTDDRVRRGEDGAWASVRSFSELKNISGPDDDSSDGLDEFSDLSEIDADYSGGSDSLSRSDAMHSPTQSGSRLSKSRTEVEEEKFWYCRVLGAELGPMSLVDLRHMIEHDELVPADLVRSEDQQDWAPAGIRLGELFPDPSLDDLLAAVPDSTAELKLPSSDKSGSRASDTPSIRDLDMGNAATSASGPSQVATPASDDCELADNVSMVDSSPELASSAAHRGQASAGITNESDRETAGSAEEPDSADAVPDNAYHGMDDDDDEPHQSLDDDYDPLNWEAELQSPASAQSDTQASAAKQPEAAVTGDASESQSAAADMIGRAVASMQQDINAVKTPNRSRPGFSFYMPDIPTGFLLKAGGIVAACVLGHFIILSIAGSGGDTGPRKVSVSGTVMFDDEPVPTGEIVIRPASGSDPTSGGQITDGKFECMVTPGSKNVSITAWRDVEGPAEGLESGESGGASEQYIPSKYSDETSLTAQIGEDGTSDLKFELTSE